ncbi:MAG: class I SAM-dependent rRNA methyltransferase [Verrucomicrobiaceae bacterium]|nr:class I SAM-dependent rRNA methyltransferase [Verrucomicrobiaceae bacterium]
MSEFSKPGAGHERPPRPLRPSRPFRPSHRPQPAPSEPPLGSESWPKPWVQIKYFSFHPSIYPNMIRAASDDAAAGDLVNVFDKEGNLFGHGFYNPKARIPLRVLNHLKSEFAEVDLDSYLRDAIKLRTETLKPADTGDAWRVIHSDGDRISGLVVDKYGDTLSIEVTSLGVWRRLRRWLPILHESLGTKHHVIHADPEIARIESMRWADVPEADDPAPKSVRIREHDIRYQVNFESGHKTGFFCDQRDNRRRFGQFARGRVLDLCCYSGGFSLAAKLIGKCDDVTGVDLDEQAIAQAKQNGNLNQTRINWVHADVFTWMRQAQKNGELWDTIVLDPPKLVWSRDETDEGRKKYNDMNVLALQLIRPGGLFVTCSCSGLLEEAEFEYIVTSAAHRYQRKLQILDRTGAGSDHPVMSNCPESRYLKTLWAVVR